MLLIWPKSIDLAPVNEFEDFNTTSVIYLYSWRSEDMLQGFPPVISLRMHHQYNWRHLHRGKYVNDSFYFINDQRIPSLVAFLSLSWISHWMPKSCVCFNWLFYLMFVYTYNTSHGIHTLCLPFIFINGGSQQTLGYTLFSVTTENIWVLYEQIK